MFEGVQTSHVPSCTGILEAVWPADSSSLHLPMAHGRTSSLLLLHMFGQRIPCHRDVRHHPPMAHGRTSPDTFGQRILFLMTNEIDTAREKLRALKMHASDLPQHVAWHQTTLKFASRFLAGFARAVAQRLHSAASVIHQR